MYDGFSLIDVVCEGWSLIRSNTIFGLYTQVVYYSHGSVFDSFLLWTNSLKKKFGVQKGKLAKLYANHPTHRG